MLGFCECGCCLSVSTWGIPMEAVMALLKCVPAACFGDYSWREDRRGGSLAILSPPCLRTSLGPSALWPLIRGQPPLPLGDQLSSRKGPWRTTSLGSTVPPARCCACHLPGLSPWAHFPLIVCLSRSFRPLFFPLCLSTFLCSFLCVCHSHHRLSKCPPHLSLLCLYTPHTHRERPH